MQRHNDKRGFSERNVGQSGSLAAAPILPHFCSNLSCNYGIQTTDRPPSPPLLKVNGMEIPTLFEVYPIFFSAILIALAVSLSILVNSFSYPHSIIQKSEALDPTGSSLFRILPTRRARPIPLANVTHFPSPDDGRCSISMPPSSPFHRCFCWLFVYVAKKIVASRQFCRKRNPLILTKNGYFVTRNECEQ